MSIHPNTRFTLTIGGTITLAIALVTLGWRTSNFLRDIRDEVADLRRELRAVTADRWSASDMERWAVLLERSNRDRPLIVPDVRTVKPDRGQ